MAPRGKTKLHKLAALLPEATVLTDVKKNTFVIEKQFATGGFGRIYSGYQGNSDVYGKKGSVAIKVEPRGNGPLFTEIGVFQRILQTDQLTDWINKKKLKSLGLPPMLGLGIAEHEGEGLRFLAMPKYARSLEEHRVQTGGSLSASDALIVARQCAHALEYMQHHNYVHSDLKAANILLSSAKSLAGCFLVDFGLARMAKSNAEVADKKRAHNGTAIFTSLDAHRGLQPSWRGDVEILAYNIVFWITGALPWSSLEAQVVKVFEAKEKFSENYKKELPKLTCNGWSEHLVEMFGIAYETPYLRKVDYSKVHEVLNAALECCNKSPSKSSTKRKTVTVSPQKSASRKKVSPRVVNKTSPKQRAAKQIARKAIKGTKAASKPKVSAPGSITPRSASKRSEVIPGLSNFPVTRRTANAGDAPTPTTSSTSKRKLRRGEESDVPTKRPSVEPPEDNKIKLDSDQASGASSTKKTLTKADKSPLIIIPSGRSPEDAQTSVLAALIPGVRNMKKLRRSLGNALLNKHAGLANKHHAQH